MGEGVRGIYRAKKQQKFSPKGIRPCTIHRVQCTFYQRTSNGLSICPH
jgi:hypothetical protein